MTTQMKPTSNNNKINHTSGGSFANTSSSSIFDISAATPRSLKRRRHASRRGNNNNNIKPRHNSTTHTIESSATATTTAVFIQKNNDNLNQNDALFVIEEQMAGLDNNNYTNNNNNTQQGWRRSYGGKTYKVDMLLRFVSPDVEARYKEYHIANKGLRGARLWVFGTCLAILLTASTYLREDTSLFLRFPFLLMLGGVFVNFAVLAYVKSDVNRAMSIFDSFFVPSSAFSIVAFMLAQTHVQARSDISILWSCTVYINLLLRLRFHISLLSFLLVVLFLVPYFVWYVGESVQIVFVPLIIVSLLVSYALNERSRALFVHVDRARQRLKKLKSATSLMELTLLNTIPHTATQLLRDRALSSSRNHFQGVTHFSTTVIVTDAAGFTVWTARTRPNDVINVLSTLFMELDAAADSHGVEKLCTVGDSYVGAMFGPVDDDDSGTPTAALRVFYALQFAIEAARLPQQLNMPLRNRVGVHVGPVHGGFVGIAPLVFDIFGRTVDVARKLESSGVPSQVHCTWSTLDAAESCGHGKARDSIQSSVPGCDACASTALFTAWDSVEQLPPPRSMYNTTQAQLESKVVLDVLRGRPAQQQHRELLLLDAPLSPRLTGLSARNLGQHMLHGAFVDKSVEDSYQQSLRQHFFALNTGDGMGTCRHCAGVGKGACGRGGDTRGAGIVPCLHHAPCVVSAAARSSVRRGALLLERAAHHTAAVPRDPVPAHYHNGFGCDLYPAHHHSSRNAADCVHVGPAVVPSSGCDVQLVIVCCLC
eukprot:PhM_4_TR4486/c1_g1_i1/m.64726